MKTCTREYWCKSGHVSGHLTRIFPLFQNTESFYKDHAKVLQLRFHFNDHTSPITVQTTRPRSWLQKWKYQEAIFATMNSPRFISNLRTKFNELIYRISAVVNIFWIM